MPTTTHFGWTTPTPGGSVDVWGDMLVTEFEAIDSQVHATDVVAQAAVTDAATAQAAADDALEAIDEQPFILAGTGFSLPITWGADDNWRGNGFSRECDVSENLDPFCVPLPHLRPGQRITGFATVGTAAGGDAAATADLCYMDNTTSVTVVSAGQDIGDTTTGLTHDVLSGRAYFVRVTPTGATGVVLLQGVQTSVVRP